MNLYAIRAIFVFEMSRTRRTVMQSVVSPVISTSLYFVVFGAAIGSRFSEVEGVSYGAFIVPGLTMLTMLQQSVSNASLSPGRKARISTPRPLRNVSMAE